MSDCNLTDYTYVCGECEDVERSYKKLHKKYKQLQEQNKKLELERNLLILEVKEFKTLYMKLRVFVNSMTDNSNFMFNGNDAHTVLNLARQCLAELDKE